MWSSWVKTNDTTQVMWMSKNSYETFSNDFGKGFQNGMMEGRMDSRKMILKLKCFSPLKILTSPFICRDSWSFSFSFIFSILSLSLSLSLFNAPSLCGLRDFDNKRGEKHSSKISFHMKWKGMGNQ
jgi:hypothetical protein